MDPKALKTNFTSIKIIAMQYFLVKIVFQLNQQSEKLKQFDEQIRLLTAADSFEAFFKARQIGHKEEDGNTPGFYKPLQWKFMDVTEIIPVQLQQDGVELFSQVSEKDAASFKRSVRQQAAKLLELQLQQSNFAN